MNSLHKDSRNYFVEKVKKTKYEYSGLLHKDVEIKYYEDTSLCGLNPGAMSLKEKQPICSMFEGKR